MKTPQLARFFKDLIYHGFESFGRYYSTYRGWVINNADPEGLNRLQLMIPEITGKDVHGNWAYPIGVFAGKSTDGVSYGQQMLPQRGDVVWVTFERGHPEVPLWQHGYPGKSEKNLTAELLDPNSFWFITPKGTTVIANDTNNYLIINLPTGETVKLDTEAFSIEHSKAISLGSIGGSAEPAILGDSHNGQMKATLDSISKLTVMTAMGPSSIPLNVADFIQQQQALDNMLSEKVTLD